VSEPVIRVRDLRRTYRTSTGLLKRTAIEVEAVRGVSFEVGQGELFGLLGPNGAGKTTTIKMLITLLLPTSGGASVLGYDVVTEPREVRRRIGYVFGGDRGLYERVPAIDNLRYFAELYGVPARDQRRRIDEMLDLVGLRGRETSGSRATRGACGSGCTSPAACSTTRRWCSCTSLRSVSTRWAPATCGRPSTVSARPARRCF
jgi:ABC-type multidrug transport system ATPase subunit